MPPGDRSAGAGRLWWLFLLRGVVALLLAASVLVVGESTERLATYIALYWLVGALLTIHWALSNRGFPGRGLGLVAAVAGVLAATLVLVRGTLEGVLSRSFAIEALGVAAVLTGILRVLGAFHDDDAIVRMRHPKRLVLGSLELTLGLLLITTGELTPVAAAVIGVWGVVGGTILLRDALRLRAAGRPPTG